jgi:predicted nucleotidyltransferase
VDPKDLRPARWPALNASEMLRRLTAAKVDFVVIGGIALVLHGSARLTRDLDIVFGPGNANLKRLGEVLVELQAKLRDVDTPLPFVPDAPTLKLVELLTLETSQGWLDVHRTVPGVAGYRDLRRDAERMEIDDFEVLVASHDDLIAMKRAAGRDRDVADLAELETMKRLRRG